MPVPILKYRGLLIVPLPEDLNDDAAAALQEAVLERIVDTEARGVVLDISSLDVVDSYFARVLNDTATMTRLLGARAVICGMQPAVALTLSEMGRQLIGVRTALDLEQGLDGLLEEIAREDGELDLDD